jgi:hypothetical protein
MATESSIQPELLSLKSKLGDEIERDENQIDLIQKRVNKNRALYQAVNASLGAIVAEATGYGALSGTVHAAIKALEMPKFTALDVEHQIRRQHPTIPLNKSGIRTTLWNLVKKGELNPVRKGTNRLPAQYEKTGSFK